MAKAITSENLDIMDFLLSQKSIKQVKCGGRWGWLHFAVNIDGPGRIKVLKKLLDHKINIDHQDNMDLIMQQKKLFDIDKNKFF